jgi:hypothetical protein
MSRDDRNLNASLPQNSTSRYNNSHERIIRETLFSLAYLSRQNADNLGGRKISGYLDQVRLQRKRRDLKFRDVHETPPKWN